MEAVTCYNCVAMSSLVTLTINEKTREQIYTLVRRTGKPKEAVLREVVETGLKSYHPIPTKGIKALIDLAAWAEENHVTGPKDLSTNHNTYAWGE